MEADTSIITSDVVDMGSYEGKLLYFHKYTTCYLRNVVMAGFARVA